MRRSLILLSAILLVAAAIDSDGDGLSDKEEVKRGTDPFKADTDSDGISDRDEIKKYGTDPLSADTDADGIADGAEIILGTNPKKADTDGDGISDGDEVGANTWMPFVATTNPLSKDSDGDGLSDGEEQELGLNPNSADSDGDGLPDKAEVKGWPAFACPAYTPPPEKGFVDKLLAEHEPTVLTACLVLCCIVTLLAAIIWLVKHPFVVPIAEKKADEGAPGKLWHKYEFSDEEEVKFTEVSKLMTLIAALFTAHAVFSAWAIFARLYAKDGPASEVLPDFFGDPLDGLQFAFFIRGAAQGFAAIERTKGNDIGYLMGAIASQKWLWKQMRVPLLIKSVKLVATAVSLLV